MSGLIDRIARSSVVDRVAAELRRAIVHGTMRPGQEFSLRWAADQLGVSFIPVREALRTLEAQGLVIAQQGRSAIVAPLGASELVGLCRLRRLTEIELHGRASLLIETRELDRLQRELAVDHVTVQNLTEDSGFEKLHEIDAYLLNPIATPPDREVLGRLRIGIARYMYAGDPDTERVRAPLARLRHELIDAYRDRDPRQVRMRAGELLAAEGQIATRAFHSLDGS
jgi:DNA-binding GntR family transcriptional regulator